MPPTSKRKRQKKPTSRRKGAPNPLSQRLGFRIGEWAKLTGVSNVTVWRAIKAGKIPTIQQGYTKLVPRSFAISAGYITE